MNNASPILATDTLSLISIDNGCLELHFNAVNSGVNVFNNATVRDLGLALDELEKINDIRGLLVTSGKTVFIAGADITEFREIFGTSTDEMKAHFGTNNANLARLESLPCPVVVAINGFALGGGLEFCLACDYRVMSTAAKIGLPETGLGIIPGWGGTVRLPRLTGLEVAIQWIATGRHLPAQVALDSGAVDQICEADALRQTALTALDNAISNPAEVTARRQQKAAALDISAEEAQAIATQLSPKLLAAFAKQIAPQRAIEHLVASATDDAVSALAAEADLLCELISGYQARALIGNFLNDQQFAKAAKVYAKQSDLTVNEAAVIGAGIMGGGIAYQNALRGMPVVMKDIRQEALDLGMGEASTLLGKQVKRGKMTEEKSNAILSSITPTLDMAPLKNTDVIVEAVVENLNVKKAVLAEIEENVGDDAIIASNTSTIEINRIAEALQRPQNFAGLHFFNPVHAMPLVEVVRGEKTSDSTVAKLVDYVLKLGKKPVVVNDCPAFLVNRTLFPYFKGFEQLVLDGADFQRVDQVMETWGWPMGPAYLADVIGIDTMDHCQEVLAGDFPDRAERMTGAPINALYKAECLGQKNGKGFYNYVKNDKGRIEKVISESTLALIDANRPAAAEFSDEDIVMRCMLPMAIEMARCLEENIVATPAEADMSLIYGLGFPSFRGGVVRWMDEVGMKALCEASERLGRLGAAYQVTDNMKAMADQGQSYYS